MEKKQEDPKSFLEQDIVTQEQRKKYLWNQIISFWTEISNLNTLKIYLINNPVRLFLGTKYNAFMETYSFTKFKLNNFDDNGEFKENLTNEDFLFLELIYNEINFITKIVNEKENNKFNITTFSVMLGKDVEDSKVTNDKDWLIKFNSLPQLISQLISVLGYDFTKQKITVKTKKFNFQKLISSKNSDILNILPSKENTLKSLTAEYLITESQNNLTTKIRILADLSRFVEKNRNQIKNDFDKGTEAKIFDELNNLNIRHNNQIKTIQSNDGEIRYEFYTSNLKQPPRYILTKNEYIEKLDKLFQLIVLVTNFLDLESVSIT